MDSQKNAKNVLLLDIFGGFLGSSILIVEDDQDIRESLLELLEMEGFSVKGVENGQLAMDYLESSKELPALILLDLMMPVKSGFEVASELKVSSRLKKIPVVVMSADGQLNQKKDSIQADAYLKKPVDIDLLMGTITKIIN